MNTADHIEHHQPMQQPAVGILLCNLGTPDAPDTPSLRRYLKEFLSDPRVVEMNRLSWWLILNGIILNTRPARSARAYQSVWTKEGSPLLLYSQRQQAALQQAFADSPTPVHVALAMRYGNPSVAHGLNALRERGCGRVLVLPLYPQYAAATTASTFDAVFDELKRWRRMPAIRTLDGYHDHPAYIAALKASVEQHWQAHGRAERLLISFHGIPQRYFDNGDPYPCLCRKTARLLAESLALPEDAWQLSFQSRFGREPWVQPYTDATLQAWGQQGLASVDVICPGFAADCLETIEEIGVENRDIFSQAGGGELRYIPALNDRPAHIELLISLCRAQLAGWL